VGVEAAAGGCRGLSGVATLPLPAEELRSGLSLSSLILFLGVMAAARFLNGDAPAELCEPKSRPSKSDALAGVALGGRTASRGEAADEIENDGDDCANAAFCAAGFVAFILNSSIFSFG
jgi:hypothetical protein